jgi:hypothetical protein
MEALMAGMSAEDRKKYKLKKKKVTAGFKVQGLGGGGA